MADIGDGSGYLAYNTVAPEQNMQGQGTGLTQVLADFYKDVSAPASQGDTTQSPAEPKEENVNANEETPRDVHHAMADKKNSVVDDAVNEEESAKKPRRELTELEKYWKVVKDNPQDFTGWTYLLQFVEQENDLQSAREAFDGFFNRYPYCYGYWKKYADLEKKHGSSQKCEEVFERGLKAIPLSVDLWIHYINFYKPQHENDPDGEEKIRRMFEQSVAAAGTEFRSDRLWEMYITWEQESKRLRHVTGLYDRLLAIPTQFYSHHYEKFEEHINKNLPKDTVSADEFLTLRPAVIKREGEEEVVSGAADAAATGTSAEVSGEEAAAETVTTKSDDEETGLLRKKIIEVRQSVHKSNEEEVGRRWTFEEGIKRPYFHVKPLERTQLKNWRDYLDFEIENGSHERVVVLFERCMIACALYEDMWLKYSKYLEGFSEDGARNVYRRACTIHLPRKPSIHLTWATFEEQHGNVTIAREILVNLEREFPCYVPVCFRRINLERRCANFTEVDKLYQHYVLNTKNVQVSSTYSIKFARYRFKVRGDADGAVKILQDAIQRDKENFRLYMQLVDIYYQSTPMKEEEATKVFDLAIQSDIAPDSKMVFAQRKVEFLEDFGKSATSLQEATDELNKLQKMYGHEKKKRAHVDDGKSDDGQKEKKVKIEMNGSMAVNNSAAAVAPSQAAAMTTADQSAYNYQNWYGSQQGYAGYQAWNPYGQQYYAQ